MAKLEAVLEGEFEELLEKVNKEILEGSLSASFEDSSDFFYGDTRCSVRVYERYSFLGGNRVSLTVTFFQKGEDLVHLSAITSGGSQAVFFKINTIGEEAFLDKLTQVIAPYRI